MAPVILTSILTNNTNTYKYLLIGAGNYLIVTMVGFFITKYFHFALHIKLEKKTT